MHAALGLALHQSGRLQGLLHPRVAQPDLMVLPELLMKMTVDNPEITLAILRRSRR
jgi:hypothetical protein